MTGLVLAVAGHESGPAEFPAPDDERIVEHPTRLKVTQQGGDGGVGGFAVGAEVAPVPLVLIPAAVIHANKTHAGLGKAPGEQALAAKVGRATGANGVVGAHAIAFEGGFGFGAHIEQLGRDGLHAVAQLHVADDALELIIVWPGVGVLAIERLHEVQLAALVRWRKVFAADVWNGGLGKILAVDADGRAHVGRWQKCGRINRRLGSVQADQAGQVLILRTEAVGDPRTHAGTLAQAFASVQLQIGLRVVAGVRVHAVDHTKLVGVFGSLG